MNRQSIKLLKEASYYIKQAEFAKQSAITFPIPFTNKVFGMDANGKYRIFDKSHLRKINSGLNGGGYESVENYGMDDVSNPYPPVISPLDFKLGSNVNRELRRTQNLNDEIYKYWQQKAKEGYTPTPKQHWPGID